MVVAICNSFVLSHTEGIGLKLVKFRNVLCYFETTLSCLLMMGIGHPLIQVLTVIM